MGNMTKETIRQIVHLGLFGLVFLLMVLDRAQMVGLLFLLFLLAWLVLPRTGWSKYLHRQAEKKYSKGALAYFGGLLLAVLLFPPHAIAAAWAALALGDGSATLVGQKFGRQRLPWNPDRSVIGSVAFVAATFIGTAFAVWFLAPTFGGPRIYTIALVAGVAGALIESIPWKVNDNLAVPLLVAFLIYFF